VVLIKLFAAILIALLIVPSGIARAEDSNVNSFAYLRKLSRRLKSKNPESQEYEALKEAITKNKEAQFIEAKIDEYLMSGAFADVMTSKLQELFRLKQDPVTFTDLQKTMSLKNVDHSDDEFRNYHSTTANFFRSLVTKDKSWDELATGKEYVIYSRLRPALGKSGTGFFAAAAPEKIPVSNNGAFSGSLEEQAAAIGDIGKSLSLDFKSSDSRVAGAITTEDFFDRYVDTTVNKGRQRAAAIFRIFMCDDLRPIIADNGDTKKHIALKVAFPQKYDVALKDIINDNANIETLHGRSDCNACHRKLDPAGRHFLNSRIVLGPQAAPGALVYDDENGKEVTIPTSGIGEFAKAMVRTPKYAECQVKNFWKWFVGSDVDLNDFPSLKIDLLTKFDSNKRRVRAFVKYLVKTPEFKQKPAKPNFENINFARIAPVLNRCNSCHSSDLIPDFSHLPFKNKTGDHAYWVNRIQDRIGLPEGDSRKMPPRNNPENAEDILKIKKWIADGARDDAGKRTIP
jgi:hypothetical protein